MFTPLLKTTSDKIQPPKLPGDVGFDLPSNLAVTIPPGHFATIHTGIHVELPPHYWGLIAPKSSANIGGALVVLSGVIDCGYRGELMVFVHNVSPLTAFIEEGTALAQLICMPMAVPKLVRVDRLSDSERGENGFGSTGNGASNGVHPRPEEENRV